MDFISHSLKKIKPSPTMVITAKARELRAAGEKIISLSAGEPDFDTPEHVKDAAIKAINMGYTKYTNVEGIPELKQAIVNKFKNDNEIDYNTDQVIVGVGGKQILFNALFASLNSGDEVIIPTPYWVSYPDMTILAGGTPKFLNCNEENDFKINPSELDNIISEKTKWIILNSPSNPSGSCYTKQELINIADVLRQHKDVNVINCEKLYICPGLVDMRVNLGEPGFEHKETIKSACMAAASGGVTSLISMPNTMPAIDQPAIIQSIQRKAREVALSKIFCTGCITRNFEGKEICELHLMKESGAVGFTDGLKTISNARVMRRALTYAKSFNGLIIQHAEEAELSHGGVMNEGEISTRMGLRGIPGYAEAMIVERDLWFVKETLCRYHVSHVSTKETLEIIKKAKNEKLPITCDTSPPYFTLNELSLENYRTFSKLTPPLRSEKDRISIVEGIIDGTIDAISSDLCCLV